MMKESDQKPYSKLNILVLEDSIKDLELITEMLKDAGYSVEVSHASGKTEFLSLISRGNFDIILSDFRLPGFDAFEALKVSTGICPDVPFICISGSIGEETATELLKLGAVDYVLKDRPDRLPFAVKRALDEARVKKQHKEAEEQVKLLSRAVEQSPVSTLITDPSGHIIYTNQLFTESTGYSAEEVLGKNPRIMKSGNQNEFFYKNLWDTILSGKDWTGELLNKKKNGKLFWEHVVISPILNGNGKITHFVAVKDDISEKKQMIDDLIEAKEKAEESDKLKSAFLRNMSHEIRTPMNGILGFMDLLRKPDLSPERRDSFIQIIEKSGHRLLNTINDIIEFSRLETEQADISLEKEYIEEIILSHFNKFNQPASEKGLKMNILRPETKTPGYIFTDRDKLDSILISLLNNALKFTHQGSIDLGYEYGEDEVVFFVKDSGIGIPENQQEAVFEPFVQADLSTTRVYEGTGLGLSLARAWVKMLKGRIWLVSKPGEGSTFYFAVPSGRDEDGIQNPSTVKKEKIVLNPGLRILVVEDDEPSFFYLETLFMEDGIEIIHAWNGSEALEILNRDEAISLILMDIKMPVMDGLEATRLIRESGRRIPVIAQTSYAFPSDINKAKEAGCTDYISKPINQWELKKLVKKYS